jgi:hypothetical protein
MKTRQSVELANEGLDEYWEGSAFNTMEIDENEKEEIL